MFEVDIAVVLVVALIALIAFGVHIAVALGVTSVLAITLVADFTVARKMVASTAYESLRDYVFAVIPLFMLMGEFIGRSGAVTDVYKAINHGLRRIPGRLAVATVLGNAVFSFVTGVSIASAAAFSRIAYPEMRRFGYHRGFALGAVAGSSCLGMLIPPSVLMIVWGILTEKSIGQIFLAGVLPGLLLMILFVLYVLAAAMLRPALVSGRSSDGVGASAFSKPQVEREESLDVLAVSGSALGIIAVVVAVLGGIWFGFFTPTEGAGAGAFIGLVLALAKGMRWQGIVEAILSVGRVAAPILLLLFTASLYSRSLAMTGVANAIQDFFVGGALDAWMVLAAMVGIWFALGMVIDSISIMLLTVPIFAPMAQTLGYDPIAFAIIGIIAIEAGLLTPPFGLLVYTVKAAIQEDEQEGDGVSIAQIFKSSTPYWLVMLLAMLSIVLFPQVATFLPELAF
ncbi:MAG: TRAP transporter large permease [Gammaproteobacteria bacterium]